MSEDTKKVMTLEEAQADLNSRVKDFNAEFLPLLGKYKLALGAEAFITRDGRVGAKPSLLDDSKVEPKEDEKKDETKLEKAE